jgi:hypothetical protein
MAVVPDPLRSIRIAIILIPQLSFLCNTKPAKSLTKNAMAHLCFQMLPKFRRAHAGLVTEKITEIKLV